MSECKNKYSIAVTYDCNWNCGFCIVDTHHQPKVTFEELKEKIDEVEPFSEVSLSGGEPGLLKQNELEYCIKTLKNKNCKINVNTNGTFFVNHKEYCDDIDFFYYHCSENLDIDKGILLDGVPLDKTEFMVVLTDENFKRLDWFIENYPNILFRVASADEAMVGGKKGTTLNTKNAIKVWKKHKDKITKDSVMYLLENCVSVNNEYKIK